MTSRWLAPLLVAAALPLLAARVPPALAQQGPGGPPAVGVIKVERRPVTEKHEFIGRIQATDRVELVARVTAFLDERLFTEGSEVRKGELLYRLERGPFEADLQAKQAAVEQATAQLLNAKQTLTRAQTLLRTPAGQQATVDTATANQRSLSAQLLAAQSQQRLSQINLDYTEIRAPIDGKIGRTAVTVGNVVGPTSGVLTTIVSQDPMYVVFPVSLRAALEMREKYRAAGAFNSVRLAIRLPDGRAYAQDGKLDFADNTVSATTDTIILRGTIANPRFAEPMPGQITNRELADGEFVTVILEAVAPTQSLIVPRSAVLADQGGDFVYVVDAQNRAQQARIKLSQASSPTEAVIESGLTEGQTVIVEGLQRVHAGQPVAPGPASPPAAAAAGG
ncbi:MAG: efflux RND transporter periplasmic adaptor subunit [Dongiaceae bacterium]